MVIEDQGVIGKYRSEYPSFEPDFCTAELLGMVFHVPCKPELILEADYGTEWRKDVSSVGYYPTLSKNVKPNGSFNASEKANVMQYY
ncbi:unnamed protein product, partial [Mesorhabditis spiculigera]